MKETNKQYDQAIKECKDSISYDILDDISRCSVTELLFTLQYIKTLENNILIKSKFNLHAENEILKEYIYLIQRCVISLIRLDEIDLADLSFNQILDKFDEKISIAYELMKNKNHDYGEAWRLMRLTSLTDMIIQKVFRIKSIQSNKGKTKVSEGIDANYLDIINYAVFYLIKKDEDLSGLTRENIK